MPWRWRGPTGASCFILLSVLKVHLGCRTLGFDFVVCTIVVGCAHPVEEACEVHTRNQKIQEPQVCLKAGLSSRCLPAHPSRNPAIHQTQSPTPTASCCPKGLAANVALFPEKWMPLRPNKAATDASLPLRTQADQPTNPQGFPPPRETVNNLWGWRWRFLKN